ncbi:MAG: carboxypeptidase-like regulatory domain-containing protein, partial [Planctomycetota bacterium]|nr:carboxypeptidase-like regulatory domain-containing protein [Planctomycetota bacterium]
PAGTLRLRAIAPRVSFGARGHRWHTVPAGDLVDGATLALPEAAAALVVRVREADGRPAVGVPLNVQPAAPGPAAVTDEGGTVVLDHLPPGLVLLDPNSELRRGPRVRARAGDDADVTIVLEPAWRVTGVVQDPAGRPLAGALVEGLGSADTLGSAPTSDERGQFTWRGPAVARLALAVRSEGFAERRLHVEPPAIGALVTDLGAVRLEGPGLEVVGRVRTVWRDADAYILVEPLVAAPLRELFGAGQVLDRPHRLVLEADGTFRGVDLPTGVPLRVGVRGAGVSVDAVVEGGSGERVEVALDPPPGERFVGNVHRPDRLPAAGVTLLLSAEPREGDRAGDGDLELVSGADGSFDRRGLAAGAWYVRAYAANCRSLHQRVVLPLAEPLHLHFEAALEDATRRVRGRVHHAIRTDVETKDDSPWVGERSTIRYEGALAGVTVRAGGAEAVTDADGQFVLEGVESLAPSIGLTYGYVPGAETPADPRAYVSQGALEVKPGGEPLELVLWRAATLRFRAVDGIDDSPLAFVHVVIRSDDGNVQFDRGVAPVDGVVEITGLPPRGSTLTVVARDRRFRKAPIALRPGERTDLGDVLLVHGMRISGRVFGPGGHPIPGARIGAYGQGWQHAEVDPGLDRELLFRTAETDLNGRFVLEGFDPRKPADLAVWARGFAPTSVRAELAKFSDVIDAEVEVHLVEGAYLLVDLHELGFRGERGNRVHGALVDIEHAHDGTDWLDLVLRGLLRGPVAADEDWRAVSEQLLYERRGVEGYVVGPVRPGPYLLWVERPGFERLRSKLTIIDPAETVLIDVVSGSERLYQGRTTRLFYELAPAR